MAPPGAAATTEHAVERLAAAKVNLTLQVLGRRDDGYHVLESLVVFAELGDRLTLRPSGKISLKLTGPFASSLAADQENLVVKAASGLAALLVAQAGRLPGAAILLDKQLPVAAGLGGGSADAAAAIDGLLELWGGRPDPARLFALAASLGADVPVCLHGQASIMSGIGEVMAPAPSLPDFALLLANPGIPLSTPRVFEARRGRFSTPDDWPEEIASLDSLVEALRDRGNDLQEAASGLAPEIGPLLQALAGLPGCRLAQLSGSGATCFGLFATLEEAEHAGAMLALRHPDCWLRATPLRSR